MYVFFVYKLQSLNKINSLIITILTFFLTLFFKFNYP